jgi:hypothetical protein
MCWTSFFPSPQRGSESQRPPNDALKLTPLGGSEGNVGWSPPPRARHSASAVAGA